MADGGAAASLTVFSTFFRCCRVVCYRRLQTGKSKRNLLFKKVAAFPNRYGSAGCKPAAAEMNTCAQRELVTDSSLDT
jgi:hypothetical protein